VDGAGDAISEVLDQFLVNFDVSFWPDAGKNMAAQQNKYVWAIQFCLKWPF
jgi:hypothetical protein